MSCLLCFGAIAFAAVLLIIWSGTSEAEVHVAKTTDLTSSTPEDPSKPTPQSGHPLADISVVPKPPVTGAAFGPERVMPATLYDERKYLELPRGGFSCANKRWYDAIYSGGTETILDAPGAGMADVAEIWAEDAESRRRETRVSRAIVPRRTGMLV